MKPLIHDHFMVERIEDAPSISDISLPDSFGICHEEDALDNFWDEYADFFDVDIHQMSEVESNSIISEFKVGDFLVWDRNA